MLGTVRRATPFLLIAAYFLWFAFDGTRAGWMEDDPMNLYMYWKPGLAAIFQYNFTFWTGFYRPLGGLFYLPIYAVAHLNPVPYHWVQFALLGLNTFLVYKLAQRLSDNNERIAFLAAIFACVHGRLSDLVFNTASIYDVMAVTFSLLSLLLYLNKPLTSSKAAGVLALMILAINAKEIAATLPAFFLLYELLYERRRNLIFTVAALVVAALAMYGKMHGVDAMTLNENYHPIFTLARWLDANATYTATIFYQQEIPAAAALGLWLFMALIAALTRSRPMAWALGVILLSTIPISFIPKRANGSLYLPLIGWAIWFAAAFDWLLNRVSKQRTAATLTIAAACFWWTSAGFAGQADWWRSTKVNTARVQKALENFSYRPPHDKHILITGSPYKDVYDLVFLASLYWNDHTLNIEDANLSKTSKPNPSDFDIVIAFKDNGTALELLKQ